MKIHEILSESPAPEFTGKLPLADAALEGKSLFSGTIKRWNGAIPKITAGLEAGEIVNTELEDIKYAVNHYVDAAIKSIIAEPFYYAGAYEKLPRDLQDLDYPHAIYNIPAYQKKLNKISAASKQTAMWKTANALVIELMDLVKVMEFFKAHTVKASVKKREAIEARKNAEGEYSKKFTDHKDVKKVSELLKKTASAISQRVYESALEGLNDCVDSYKAKIKSEGHTDYTKIFERSPYIRFVIQSITERTDKNGYRSDKPKEFKLAKGYKATLEKMAHKHADEVIDHFVHKNANKISYVLYNKNNLKTVTIDNVNVSKGIVECDVNCKFEDGSSFTARSSVVYHVSKLGKWFYRYPTLFNSVVMPDGSKLPGATEKKMDEIFALAK